MIYNIIYTIDTFFSVYALMILVRCLLTWLPNINWENPIIKGLRLSVDIYLDLFKKFIPPIGPFDISPMIAFFALGVIRYIIYVILILLIRILGS